MTERPALKLSQLGLTARAGMDPQITGLAVDSREVQQGFVFAALPGSRVHGAKFVDQVLDQGAVAILTDTAGAEIAGEAIARAGAALVVAEDPRQALSGAAALWFGGQPPVMAAVTMRLTSRARSGPGRT